MKGTWKEAAHRRIQRVIAENPTVTDEKVLRRLISEACPFGERCNHPYKAWLDAVKETFAQPIAHNLPPKQASVADWSDSPLFGGEA